MRPMASAAGMPRCVERPEVLDAGGDGGAELLGVGGAGVVEAGAVDRDDAQVRPVGAESGDPCRDGVELQRRVSVSVPVPAASSPSGSAPSEPERRTVAGGVGGLLPPSAGRQHDGGEIEQDALERRADDVGRDRLDAGEVEQHGRRAALELLDGPAGAGGGVDALADIPTVGLRARRRAAADERGAAREPGGVGGGRVGRRVERLDRDAVVGRRAEARERRVGCQLAGAVQRLGHRRRPLAAVGGGEVSRQDEVRRHVAQDRNRRVRRPTPRSVHRRDVSPLSGRSCPLSGHDLPKKPRDVGPGAS